MCPASCLDELTTGDMKVGQAEKFVQARQDPSFAGVMQIKELSIDQAESQARLREMVQVRRVCSALNAADHRPPKIP